MSQDDLFCNARYVERASQFALQVAGDMQQNMHKPVLILIQNKYPGRKRLSSEEATNKFFSANPDAASLYMFFVDVRCLIMPFKHTGGITNNNEHFNQQVEELQNLLTTIYEQHQGRLLPHLPWLVLTREISQKLSKNETINMHMILKDILIQEKTPVEDDIITFFFRRLYEKRNIHSTRWFHYCRDFAIELLARFIAYRLRKHNFEGFHDLVKTECEDRLKELWKLLDEYRPCEALYMGKGYAKEKNRPVFCYQHKGAHDTMHKTSEIVHGASWWRILLERFLELSTVDKWDGSFYTDDKTSDNPGKEMGDKLFRMTNEYWNKLRSNPIEVYTSFNHFLHKSNINIECQYLSRHNTCFCCLATHIDTSQQRISKQPIVCSTCYQQLQALPPNPPTESVLLQSNTIVQNECLICMSCPREMAFDPCFDRFCCQSCAEKIFIKFKKCPVCKIAAKGVKKING